MVWTKIPVANSVVNLIQKCYDNNLFDLVSLYFTTWLWAAFNRKLIIWSMATTSANVQQINHGLMKLTMNHYHS